MTSVGPQSAPISATTTTRLYYLDNLRVLLISLIVLLHLAITYGAPGSWYVYEVETGNLSKGSLIVFSLYNATVQAFALGFFFFLSGYFTASSLEQKGSWRFLKDRLIRLGIPLVAYMFILNPITIYLLHYRNEPFVTFFTNYIIKIQFSTGPMWFVAALILFTFIYIFMKSLTRTDHCTVVIPFKRPGLPFLFMLTFGTGVAAFVIRLFFRVGWSVPVINFQLGYFAEYIITFFIGAAAWRIRWFEHLSVYRSKIWFVFTAGVISMLPVFLIVSGDESGITPFEGGFLWQSLAYAMWEPFVCIGMIIGLSSLFADHLNGHEGIPGVLAPNAYAVYIIHPQVLIALTAVCASIDMPPLMKFAVMTPVALSACFATAMAIRVIPGMKRII